MKPRKESTMTKHTPTPYEYSGNSEVISVRNVTTLKPVCFIKPADYNDADFFVRACNNHDRLIEALEKIAKYSGEPCRQEYDCKSAHIAEQALKQAKE